MTLAEKLFAIGGILVIPAIIALVMVGTEPQATTAGKLVAGALTVSCVGALILGVVVA